MNATSVSVIMCVRDGEAYLSDALDSIAAQQYEALDVIVIDDGSGDRSAAIAKAHRLGPKVISQSPQGIGAAINRGLQLAGGAFVGFLDCDDVWSPGRLRDMLDVLVKDAALDGVHGGVVNTDSELRPIAPPVAARLAGAMLMRRQSALSVGDFRTDVAHAAIVDWISRANQIGLRFVALDRVVLLRRIHGENVGIRQRPEARGDMLRMIRDHIHRKR
jgi:glycosyltransferase involved in cell wall biosynthesis